MVSSPAISLTENSLNSCTEGRVDPIPFHVKQDMTGLGKYGQDERMIETTVSQRRELASERILKESEEQRAEREVFRLRCARSSQIQYKTGHRSSPGIHPIGSQRNPSTFLLHRV